MEWLLLSRLVDMRSPLLVVKRVIVVFSLQEKYVYSRGRLRRKYDINGNVCNDCLASSYCPYCALVQEGKEIDEEEEKVRGLVENLVNSELWAFGKE